MAEGKYVKIGGAIKQVVGEYAKVGGAIVTGTINAVDIDGIKQITLAEADRYIYTSESVNDELYRITDTGVEDWHYDLADALAVAVNSDGESYWCVGTTLVKLYADGSFAWSHAGWAETSLAVALENRLGVTYVYYSDFGGGVICLRDNGASSSDVWSVNVDITFTPPVYALAVDAANGLVYAGVGVAAASKGVWRAAVSTGTFVKIFSSSYHIMALACDTSGRVYSGDSHSNYNKLSSDGYVYWTKTRGDAIHSIEIAHNGYGYFTCESEKKVCKFEPSTGVTIWEYTPGLSSYAYACAVDAEGNVYVVYRYLAGSSGNFIYKVDKNGNYVTRWQSYVNVKFYGMAATPGLEAAGF